VPPNALNRRAANLGERTRAPVNLPAKLYGLDPASARRDVDEVGYTLRTASLMTDPEYFFDDRDPSDYRLFGIRYLILPARDRPPVRAAGDALRPR
jgi:hypothetical protein